ncbi:MAG: hypothetical protein IIX54_02875 [Clostridia bacterium]|nr:hypothetical protein [Clostridia bacterium]
MSKENNKKKSLKVILISTLALVLAASIVLTIIFAPIGTWFGGNSPDTDITSSIGPTFNNIELSNKPTVTAANQVATGICVVTGYCSDDTEKIVISGNNVVETTTKPFAGKDKRYFMVQVPYTATTALEVKAIFKDGKESDVATKLIAHKEMKKNYMYLGEYTPVIGKNGQMHFYSALLSYSLSTGKITSSMNNTAKKNINNIVKEADKLGAETIFVVIPSTAALYPETVPDDFTETTDEKLYERFTAIAEECGAKVMYPIETMSEHVNDGDGYQLYQRTDSHWSTYGSYWGTYDLFNYIAEKFPNAKPRTLKEMGFYTTEMYGGDGLFSFAEEVGFEVYYSDKITRKTKIMELTTRYKLKMPTNTLDSVYKSNMCLSLTDDNAKSDKVVNPKGTDLPSALIMRDSFGKVSYDMMNDRFSTVYWGEFNNYKMPLDLVDTDHVDYVIYLYSERNLLKIMMNDAGANILNLK